MPSSIEFSEASFEELRGLLARRPVGIADITELEGFLTAAVIGPETLLPSTWLPRAWGTRLPSFPSVESFTRYMELVLAYYNDVVAWFEQEPDAFEPTFYERRVAGQRYVIVDEWCRGFMKGVRLGGSPWRPLKEQRPELLEPIWLFGTPAGLKRIDAEGGPAMHRMWSGKIAPAVRGIHRYWLPQRAAARLLIGGQTRH